MAAMTQLAFEPVHRLCDRMTRVKRADACLVLKRSRR
jgi:hypothetical protein